MAKSSRSSSKKANNRRLASAVFSPAEAARAERLNAKLLELAQQPKPETSSAKMELADDSKDASKVEDSAMEVDIPRAQVGKRVDRRKQRVSKIVFQKYSDRLKAQKKRSMKAKASKP